MDICDKYQHLVKVNMSIQTHPTFGASFYLRYSMVLRVFNSLRQTAQNLIDRNTMSNGPS